MWCPSATLSVWANAWLAGKAAPDDVLDALSCWAPTHSVTAYDSVAAGHTGLPWPDVHDAGAVSLLQTVRTAAGRATTGTPSIKVVLPVPGDVRGLAPGTQFERDALAAGEAVIVTHPDDPGVAVGLVPEFGYDESRRRTRDPRVVRAVVDRLLAAAAPRLSTGPNSARPNTRCDWRFGPRPMRSPPSGWDQQASTSTIRAGWWSSCWNPHGITRFPSLLRRAHCGCWRTPHTWMRSSPSAPG